MINALKDIVYPRRCPVCTGIVNKKRKNSSTMPQGINLESYICPECYERLDFIQAPYCMRCGRKLGRDEEEYCRSCSSDEIYFDANRGMLAYSNEYADRIVWDLKYNNRREYADFLALELARRYGRYIERGGCQAIVPVPVHPARKRARGYNQMEVLSHRLSELLDIPVDAGLLKRVKKTAPLKVLSPAQRLASLKSAFLAMPDAGKYRSLLVLDDIYTTGATLQSCARALKAQGTERVYGLTCCIGRNEE